MRVGASAWSVLSARAPKAPPCVGPLLRGPGGFRAFASALAPGGLTRFAADQPPGLGRAPR
eukprot:8833623-Pyramimonas_sp.AAC.1